MTTPQDARDARDMIRVAMDQIVEAWSMREDEGMAAETLMSALSELRCASWCLEPSRRATEPSTPAEPDIEPSVGDVVGATEPSEQDDPVQLARSMQGKRHGGAP